MNDKRTRYGIKVFTLDKIERSVGCFAWTEKDIASILEDYETHFGLKPISLKEEVHIVMEYSNIIWDYKIYLSSFKKKFKPLAENDDRFFDIGRSLEEDLKTIGLVDLKNEVLESLKNQKFFEYNEKSDKQFKKYCVSE